MRSVSGKRLQRLAQERAQIAVLDDLIRSALDRRRLQIARVDLARDRLPLLAHAAIVIDAQVAADADDPGLEIGAPVERLERLEDLQEDVLRQILGLVVLADELVGDVEDLSPVLADDGVPGRLVAAQTLLDEAVGRDRLRGRGVNGHASSGRQKAQISGNDIEIRTRCASPRLALCIQISIYP